MVEFDVPSEDELEEMRAGQDSKSTTGKDIWNITPDKTPSPEETKTEDLSPIKPNDVKRRPKASYVKFLEKNGFDF
jgi:hypothetical protein